MRRGLPAVLVLIGAYGLLGIAWAIGDAPFAAPDEKAHYLRTIGIAEGSLIGRRTRYFDPAQSPQTNAWTTQTARTVSVPGGLSPAGLDCMVARPLAPAACQNAIHPPAARTSAVSTTGSYQPLAYLLPAAVIELAHRPTSADRLARLAGLAVWLALLAGAALALSGDAGRGGRGMTGLVVSVTPMAVFVGASLTGSGLEVAAGLAFPAALLRITRPAPPPAWVWGLLGAAGTMLALSRSLGPAWVALDAVAVLALSGAGRARRRVRERPVAAALAGIAVLVGVALNRIWESTHEPSAIISLSPLREGLGTARRALDDVLLQAIGNFGFLELKLPAVAYAVWAAMIAALVLLAWSVAPRRGRLVIAALIGCSLAFPVVFYVVVAQHSGIPLQGRHVLPLLVLVPLVAGDLLLRNVSVGEGQAVVRGRLGALARRATLVWFAVPAAAVQLVAWYVAARRYAVGTGGPHWFLPDARWAPPAGWWPWLTLAVIGAAGLVAAGIVARRTPSVRDTARVET